MTGQSRAILIVALLSLILWGFMGFSMYVCWNIYQAWDDKQVQERVSLIIRRADETARMVTYLRINGRETHIYDLKSVEPLYQKLNENQQEEFFRALDTGCGTVIMMVHPNGMAVRGDYFADILPIRGVFDIAGV